MNTNTKISASRVQLALYLDETLRFSPTGISPYSLNFVWYPILRDFPNDTCARYEAFLWFRCIQMVMIHHTLLHSSFYWEDEEVELRLETHPTSIVDKMKLHLLIFDSHDDIGKYIESIQLNPIGLRYSMSAPLLSVTALIHHLHKDNGTGTATQLHLHIRCHHSQFDGSANAIFCRQVGNMFHAIKGYMSQHPLAADLVATDLYKSLLLLGVISFSPLIQQYDTFVSHENVLIRDIERVQHFYR